MKKREDKGRLSPFVPLLIETLDAPAWRAVSHGAARLYIALRRRYSPHRHNNGHIYLSLRVAHKELRSDPKQIARWFRELEHYGFIVMTTQGYLGIDGKGKAPHWRLTELGTPLGQPTRDFLSWKGGKFRASKIQNPEGEITHSVRVKSPTPLRVKSPTPPPPSEGEITHISEPPTVGEITLVTRLTTPGAASAPAAADPGSHSPTPDPAPPEYALDQLQHFDRATRLAYERALETCRASALAAQRNRAVR